MKTTGVFVLMWLVSNHLSVSRCGTHLANYRRRSEEAAKEERLVYVDKELLVTNATRIPDNIKENTTTDHLHKEKCIPFNLEDASVLKGNLQSQDLLKNGITCPALDVNCNSIPEFRCLKENSLHTTTSSIQTCALHCGRDIDVYICDSSDKWIGPRPLCQSKEVVKPVIMNCPTDMTVRADPLTRFAVVTWNSPLAFDGNNAEIKLKHGGPSPRSKVGGHSNVFYTAIDQYGNIAICSFTITVVVSECENITPPKYALMRQSHGYPLLDSTVEYMCYDGYSLQGDSLRKCEYSGDGSHWSGETPVCNPIRCQSLTSPTWGTFSCTSGNSFHSQCELTCQDGFAVSPGVNAIVLCKENGQWDGDIPYCVDVEKPTFLYCPSNTIRYTDNAEVGIRVTWQPCTVSDNVDILIHPVLVEGKQSGSIFDVGYQVIKYEAKDTTGNVGYCEFSVNVIETSCPPIVPAPQQTVTCTNGYLAGAECTFHCHYGYKLIGESTVTCEASNKNGVWYWNWDGEQPRCQIIMCPELPAPANGQLICDLWGHKRLCRVECNQGYEVPRDYDYPVLQYVCSPTGIWGPHSEVPDCVALPNEKEDLPFLGVGDLMDERLHGLADQIQSLVTSGNLSLPALRSEPLQLEKESFTTGRIEIFCSHGSLPRPITYSCVDYYQDSEGRLRCKRCPHGTSTATHGSRTVQSCRKSCDVGYYSKDGLIPCSPCAKGSYQSHAGRTTCYKCPVGKTTLQMAMTSETFCTGFDVKLSAKRGIVFSSIPGVIHDGMNLQQFTLSFWIHIVHTFENIVSFAYEDRAISEPSSISLFTNDTGSRYTDFANVSITHGRWHRIGLVWDGVIRTCTLYKDGVVDSMLLPNETSEKQSTSTNGIGLLGKYTDISRSLAIRGANITGGITNFFLWDRVLTSQQIQQLSASCGFNDSLPQPTLSWSDLINGLDENVDLQLPSMCDDEDECESSPCEGHSTCIDKIGGFQCVCSTGLTGPRCELNIDDCIQHACQNGAVCKDGLANYTCECSRGYRGTLCEIEIVNGQWSDWSEWTICSQTCGKGEKTRWRQCSNPPPDPGGENCEGLATDVTKCNNKECPEMEVPDKLTIKYRLRYPAMECSNKEQETSFKEQIDKVVAKNLNTVKCVHDTNCNIDNVKIQNCNHRQKRDDKQRNGVVVDVQISKSVNKITNVDNKTDIAEKNMQSLKSAIMDLESAASSIKNKTRQQLFDITLNDQTVSVDSNTSEPEGVVACPSGMIRKKVFCVKCAAGSYFNEGKCLPCPLNHYQDEEGQTVCMKCPTHLTTEGEGATSITECIEITTIPALKTGSSNDTKGTNADDKTKGKKEIYGEIPFLLTFITIPILIVILLVAAYVCRCWRRKRRIVIRQKKRKPGDKTISLRDRVILKYGPVTGVEKGDTSDDGEYDEAQL
ncbi:uncharacterized protein LOC144439752 [Glandiceps talaboti]